MMNPGMMPPPGAPGLPPMAPPGGPMGLLGALMGKGPGGPPAMGGPGGPQGPGMGGSPMGALMGGMPMMPPPPMQLHDVKVVRTKKVGQTRLEAIPPEECGVSRRAKLGKPLDFFFHETNRSVGDLIDEGYDPDELKDLPTATFADNTEAIERDTVNDRSEGAGYDDSNNANRQVTIAEYYVKMMYEGDDKSCLYKVVCGGGESSPTILTKDGEIDIEKVEEIPIASITPIIMSHRFFGRSAADTVMDIQRIKTALIRATLDNAYLASNQRLEVAETLATDNTIDDLLTNRPGSFVRTKEIGGIQPIPNQEIGSFVMPLIEYQDQQRENRTGVSRQAQQLAPQALRNVGEDAILSLLNLAQARLRLIARIFAETGVKDLMMLVHATTRRNQTHKDTVELTGGWTDVDPRDWRKRKHMRAKAGIGTGANDKMLMYLQNMLGIQKEAIMLPGQTMVGPQQIFNTLKEMGRLAKLKSIEPFFVDPSSPEGQQKAQQAAQTPPPPDAKMAKVQADAQQKQAEHQAETVMDQQRFQRETQQMMMEMRQQAAQDAQELRLQLQQQAQQMMIERQRMQMQHDEAIAKINAELEARTRQQDLEAALSREQMAMKASVDMQATDTQARVDTATAVLDAHQKHHTAVETMPPVKMGGKVG